MKIHALDRRQALDRLQVMAEGAYDYFGREKAKLMKQKRITRLDHIFVGFLVVLAIVIFSLPKADFTSSSHGGAVSTGGKGGVFQASAMNSATSSTGKGGAAPTTAQGPCQQPSTCLSQPTTSLPNVPPVDPVGVVNNWNGKSLAGQTYAANGADWLANNNGTGAIFQTDPKYTVDNGAMNAIWKAMAGTVASFLTIMLMLTGYRIMGGAIGIRYVSALEALPRVLLAGLGALLSIIFVAFALAVENGLCQIVVQQVAHSQTGATAANANLQYTDIVRPASAWVGDIGKFLLAMLGAALTALLGLIPGIGWIVGAVVATAAGIGVFLGLGQAFILSILSIVLAVQLIARIVMINIYAVISPLAIGCWALPSQLGQDVARQWARGFLSLVFVQFLQVLCLTVGILLFQKHTGDWTNFAGDLINFIGPIAILWLTIRIPRMFGSSAVRTIAEAGSTVTGVAAGAAAAIAIAR